MTAINTRKDVRELHKALEAFSKRSKAIVIKHVIYSYEYVDFQISVSKTTGKVYKEMVEYLNSILPYQYNDDGEYKCSWWYSYDDTLVNPYVEGKWEAVVSIAEW